MSNVLYILLAYQIPKHSEVVNTKFLLIFRVFQNSDDWLFTWVFLCDCRLLFDFLVLLTHALMDDLDVLLLVVGIHSKDILVMNGSVSLV